MKALITGASSGIGRDMAKVLSNMGYDLILVARRKDKLLELSNELKTEVEIINIDISSTFNCMKLYNKTKKADIDVIVNNAGFGVYGEFAKTKIDLELDMIDLNIKSLHTLTKLYLKDFKEKNKGYILNVASAASFMPGPLMASYYATKAYVLHFSEAISEELRKNSSNVYIGALCPGPVATEFNSIAGVSFNLKSLDSYDVALYGIKQMFKRKTVIIPGTLMKITIFCSKFVSRKLKLKISYSIQEKKH